MEYSSFIVVGPTCLGGGMSSPPPLQPAATLPGASAPMEAVTTTDESRLLVRTPITLDTTISAAACTPKHQEIPSHFQRSQEKDAHMNDVPPCRSFPKSHAFQSIEIEKTTQSGRPFLHPNTARSRHGPQRRAFKTCSYRQESPRRTFCVPSPLLCEEGLGGGGGGGLRQGV